MGRVAVVGLGNLLLKDDGVGVWLVRQLETRPLPDGIDAFEIGTSVFALPSLLEPDSRVLLVDAMDGGDAPGTIYRCSCRELVGEQYGDKPPARPLPVHALHDFRLPDMLATREFQGLGSYGQVFGVQPGEIDYGYGLSPGLAQLLPRLVRVLTREAVRMRDCDPETGSSTGVHRGG